MIEAHTIEAADDAVGMGYAFCRSEIRMMTLRISSSEVGRDAYAYRDGLRATLEELSEIMISIAATASLIGYRQDECADWRFQFAASRSPEGRELVAMLDELRQAVSEKIRMTRRYIVTGKGSITSRRSIALMCLALDAVPATEIADFAMIAGISRRSRDPVDDAQAIAEQHDYDQTTPSNY